MLKADRTSQRRRIESSESLGTSTRIEPLLRSPTTESSNSRIFLSFSILRLACRCLAAGMMKFLRCKFINSPALRKAFESNGCWFKSDNVVGVNGASGSARCFWDGSHY